MPESAPVAPKRGRKKWLLVAAGVVVVLIVVVALANKSDDPGLSGGGGSFNMRIADQAVFLSGDFGDIGRLAEPSNAPAYCEDASASLQRASEIVNGWSSDLQKAWSAAEGHFETALTACRASDGEAMAQAYSRGESLLQGLRTLLGNLDCHLDPQDSASQICK